MALCIKQISHVWVNKVYLYLFLNVQYDQFRHHRGKINALGNENR